MKKRNSWKVIGLALGLALGSSIAYQPIAKAVVSGTTTRTVTGLGNGSTTSYVISFPFQANSEIEVWLRTESSTPYTASLLVYGTGAGKYTITGGDPGTTVVMGTAPTTSQRLIIRRVTPKTQTVDYDPTAAFPADDHEEAMDRFAMVLQEMEEEVGRTPKFESWSSTSGITFPIPTPSGLVGWNSGGTDLQNYSLDTIASGAGALLSANNLSDVADAASSRSNLGLGTAAVSDDTDFEPADPALQAHLTDTSNPHSVTATQVGSATAQWNAGKIQGVTVDDSNKADGRVLSFQSGSGNIEYVDQTGGGGSGSVTTVSVVSANGFAGSVANATTTPAITVSTSITGVLKGNGTAISAAASGTDYSAGTSALATGILKSTTSTGALTIATAPDFPTLNQNTSGSAASLSQSLTANLPVIGNGTGVTVGARSGNTTTFATTTGTLNSGNCVQIDASGNLVDAGAACGSGSFANPMTTLGDLIYENSTPAPARLAGNTTSTKKFLSQTGTGSISAAPAWSQPAFTDITGAASLPQVITVTGTRASPQSITAGGGVTATAAVPIQTILIAPSGGGAVVVTASPAINAGTVVGQHLTLIIESSGGSITIPNNLGTALNGDWVGQDRDTIVMNWDGFLWVEESRSR